ncbi:hypothetical protein E2C01_041652 [Portunus trituberculatus]|uniref:Uncharacterized protein n=1 Tax=Portunus trituberculatus TaxID=210409 RepID=A0A5B7FKH7_PORTR|nr:hypothetical protein [Portunus trituberculatus]
MKNLRTVYVILENGNEKLVVYRRWLDACGNDFDEWCRGGGGGGYGGGDTLTREVWRVEAVEAGREMRQAKWSAGVME